VTRDVYREMFSEPFPETGNPWQDAITPSVSAAAKDLLRRNTDMLKAGIQ